MMTHKKRYFFNLWPSTIISVFAGNASLLYFVFEERFTFSNDSQPSNANRLIKRTEGGMFILNNDSQSSKALVSINVNERGSSNSSKDSQPAKVDWLISVIEEGIETSERDEQPLNANIPIELTDVGIVIVFNEVHSQNA